jgi:hypothetical protein
MNRLATISLVHAMEGLMKTQFVQVKGLGAWYVAASELGRDRLGSDGSLRVEPKRERALRAVHKPPTSGLMTLLAVCAGAGTNSEIVDFEWAYVSPLAARLLDGEPRTLIGHRLLSVIDEQHERSALFDYYCNVIAHGACEPVAHAHEVDGCPRMLRHSALRLGEGVLVTLSDVTDTEREAPRIQWQRLDVAFESLSDHAQAWK